MAWEWADKGCEETFWVEEYSKSQYRFGLYVYVCVCVRVYDGIWKEILYTVKIYVFHLHVNFISKEKYKYQIVVNDMHIEVLGEAYWSDAYFEIHWKVGWIDGWKCGEMEKQVQWDFGHWLLVVALWMWTAQFLTVFLMFEIFIIEAKMS